MQNGKIIERYLKAMEKALKRGNGGGRWPATEAQLQSSFSDIASLDLYHVVNLLFEKHRLKEIAKRIPPFSVIFPLRQAGIIGLKVAKKFQPTKISQKDILDFFFKLIELLKFKVYSDPFCLDGRYLIFPQEKIKEILKKTNWQVPNSTEKKEIVFLSTTLESYSWSFFYDSYRSTGFEIHGPYDASFLGKGLILLIKNGHNLAPFEIWKRKYHFQSITLYLVYQKAKIELDFFNRQFSPEPIRDKLKYCSLLVNGKERRIKEIPKINKSLEELATKQAIFIGDLKPLEIIKKGAEIYYYSQKAFFEMAGKDWRPPKKIYNQIEKMGMRFWQEGAKKREKRPGNFYCRLFDPRNDFYGE